ncbi:MAG TPA: MATE family efflux transporter [Chloroflexota bacterium]|nr:MATE family efflux transporter [Chloroflexota bacterium]
MPTAAPAAADPGALPFPGAGSLRRRVFGLAWPTIAENLLQTLVGIVDTLLVARLGAEAIAGVGASLQVMFLVIGVLSSVSVGSSILVAQAIGARDRRRANALAKQAVVWGALLAVPLSVAGWLVAEPTGHWMGLAPEVAPITAGYLRITLGGSLFLVLMYVCGAVLRGAGDARSPMLAMLVANLLNATLAFLLIFGHLGLPALGPQGSAWAALTGRAVATGLLLFALVSGWRVVCIRGRGDWRPHLGVARRIFTLGVPAGAEQAITSFGFLCFTILMASQGTEMLAAQRITFNALSLAFLPGIGFGLATTALVGMSVGARRVELGGAAAGVAARWALLWLGVVSGTYFVCAPLILALFQPDPTVAAAGQRMLRIIALAQPGWALVFVYSGALRGLGNTLFPLVVNAGGIWLVVASSALLLRLAGTDAVAPWWGFVVMAPVMAGLSWRRFTRSVARWREGRGALDAVPRPTARLPASPPPETV